MIFFALSITFCNRLVTFQKPLSLLVRNKFRQSVGREELLIQVYPVVIIYNFSHPYFSVFIEFPWLKSWDYISYLWFKSYNSLSIFKIQEFFNSTGKDTNWSVMFSVLYDVFFYHPFNHVVWQWQISTDLYVRNSFCSICMPFNTTVNSFKISL